MARSPAKEKPAAKVAARGADRKKAVADAAARAPVRVKPTVESPTPPSKPAVAGSAEAPAVKGRLFAVTRSRGRAWNSDLPMEQQHEWAEHAQFMNGLEASGLVIAGGPLEDSPYTFLVMRAESAGDVRAKLAADPWETSRLLETTRIAGWDLKLGIGRL